jgi:hypothetical protein
MSQLQILAIIVGCFILFYYTADSVFNSFLGFRPRLSTISKELVENINRITPTVRMPQNGDKIVITWLPNNNGYPNPNAFIGSKGVVQDVDSDGFVLRM